MNEQQLQQILINAQQAIAAAATAAVINSLLNPQQAGAGLLNANTLPEPTSNDLQQHQTDSRQQSPVATSSPANLIDGNNGIQELLLRLQQQAAGAAAGPGPCGVGVGGISQPTTGPWASPLQPNLGGSPMSQSPVSSRHLNQQSSSNNIQQPNQLTPNKKLKRHHQSPAQQLPPQNRTQLEPTSKPQHSTPKNHSLANLGNRNNPSNTTTSSSSSSSSAFLTNNVGLPRKLVRGQDVWLGRGAEQTRQILKCMWCGQSFRTLAEMTQHMKITQHYTNIISQEQITSWRQPESSDNKNNKQPAQQARSLDDNHDDMSDRFNESDRDDSFSNDDEIPQQPPHARNNKSRGRAPTAMKRELTPANDNSSTAGSIKEETSPIRHSSKDPSSLQRQSSTTLKPLTRSRRRENDEDHQTSNQTPEDMSCRENSSPASNSSTSQQRLSISVLGDLNEDSETNKESKRALKTDESSQEVSRVDSEDEQTKEAETKLKSQPVGESRDCEQERDDDNEGKHDDCNQINGDEVAPASSDKEDEEERDEKSTKEDDSSDDRDDEVDRVDQDNLQDANSDRESQEKDNNESEKMTKKSVKRIEPDPIVVSSAPNSSDAGAAKGLDSGDPLSELETMVEKSFDPRLRPGISNGGILQRLGIDEEVCPPWQHINYANWYAAAAYGHPMAAALLAAGINLQNGIKLSKNTIPKEKEED